MTWKVCELTSSTVKGIIDKGVTLYLNDVEVVSAVTVQDTDTFKMVSDDGLCFKRYKKSQVIEDDVFNSYKIYGYTGTPNIYGKAESLESQMVEQRGAYTYYYTNTLFFDFSGYSEVGAWMRVSFGSVTDKQYIPPTPEEDTLVYTFKSVNISELSESNSKCFIDDVEVSDGAELYTGNVLKFVANDGYEFYEDSNGNLTAYLTGTNSDDEVIYLTGVGSENNTIVSTTVTVNDGETFTDIVTSPQKIVIPPKHICTFTVGDVSEATSNGVTMFINDVSLVGGEEFTNQDTFKCVAGSGYEFFNMGFSDSGIWSLYRSGTDDNGLSTYLNPQPVDGSVKILFLNGSEVDLSYNPDFGSFHVATTQADIVAGVNNVFKIDSTKLAEINASRFTYSGTSTDVIDFDYGKYILNVIELPFSISDDLILEPEAVKLASLDTGVMANKVVTDKIAVDLGDITIPEVNKNFIDYKNTVSILRLPRVTGINIPLEYLMGKKVNISYVVDVYTGIATVNIKSFLTGYVVHSEQVSLGITIPYASNSSDAKTITNSNINVSGDNDITKPFIEIVRNDAILSDGFFTSPVPDEGVLANHSGFITVDEINLKSNILLDESEKLKSLLRNGVIILWFKQ